MRPIFRICSLACAMLLTFVFVPTVSSADITIPAGTDFLYTQPGTFFNFPNIGRVDLVGNPVFANGSDTMVQRLADADATTGAPIKTQIIGLSLLGTGPLSGVPVTLDPNHLAEDTGTMSFLVTSPTNPGTEISGTITDTLNVFFQAIIPGVPVPVTGHEVFTSFGFWEAFLPAGANEVVDLHIIIDTHVDPNGVHVVSSFVPEPSSWILVAIGGLVVPAYAAWRRRRPWQTRVG
jgi:PEP-CTERM motif